MRIDRLAFPILLAAVAVCAPVWTTPARADTSPTANAKVCRLMPVADLERALGAKATSVTGTDDPSLSTCTAKFGPTIVSKLQYAKAGINGLPVDMQTMLAIPRQMQAEGQKVTIQEFGDIGCYGQQVALDNVSTWSSVCGDPKGFITLAVARPSAMLPLDTLRKLLATARAKI